ncbi:MAG TPA: ubiquitin-like small modifier protein 1 [Symbiobacteriaceae bacterium]|nr:ubiquitin-like small modifier protein 1 [Symbiobacteriaceae bacterium]
MEIKLFAAFRQPGTGRVEIMVGPGATVRDALHALFERYPALRSQVMDPETGELQPFVQVMLKGRLVRDLQGLDTPVTNDSHLALFPPVAGG